MFLAGSDISANGVLDMGETRGIQRKPTSRNELPKYPSHKSTAGPANPDIAAPHPTHPSISYPDIIEINPHK
ncbi:hypothetical protein MHBO_004490 [Bonamia ostreae]|uniref:Uncharacterized protein n=1 Tax=Bonamia ostreae TaxID=126728 RepID=A0ABV2ATM5_9EUKA